MSIAYAVILAGGAGIRVGGDRPKQLMPLKDRPVIGWTLEPFQEAPDVDRIIVVSPLKHSDEIKDIIGRYGFNKVVDIVAGGTTRQQSAYNALTSRDFDDDDIILLHDAARPFISTGIISRCLSESRISGAAGVYVPAVDTIAEIDSGFVHAILDRSKLYCTQTPQSFRYSVIRDSHEKALRSGMTGATDDVSLAVSAGYGVRMVLGDYANQKITSAHDYRLANLILEQK